MREYIQNKWNEKGFKDLTPIQEATKELIQNGEDVVAVSPTGTGKTLAYLLPLLEKIEINHELQAIILVPSQELAQQIGEVIREWKLPELTMLVLAGGANVKRQIENLKKKPELVVGTPGRLTELANQRKLKLHQVQTLVLDEADYLLAQEHLEQTRSFIKKCPSQRQMICFSATKNEILESIHQWINMTPTWVEQEQKMAGNGNVKHVYIESPVRKKDELLRKFANMKEYQALVFVNSLANAGILAEKLQYHNIPCALLTSQENQINRKAAIQAFKKGEVPILLTTDVAARGLDIEDLPVVIHYDLPENKEVYTHRSGRTGRMGKDGLVISFVTEKEVRDLKKLIPADATLEAFQVHSSQLQVAQKKKMVEKKPYKPKEKKGTAKKAYPSKDKKSFKTKKSSGKKK